MQNPGANPSRILSLPLVELAEKLKEGSLSAESVLYTYVDKVSCRRKKTLDAKCLNSRFPVSAFLGALHKFGISKVLRCQGDGLLGHGEIPGVKGTV